MTGSRSSSFAKSGEWSIGGGRRSRCHGATSKWCCNQGRTPLSFATRSAAAGSPSAGRNGSIAAAKKLVEVAAGCVDVEQPRAAGPRIPERVLDSHRSGDERAGPEAKRLVFHQEVGFSLEDVE